MSDDPNKPTIEDADNATESTPAWLEELYAETRQAESGAPSKALDAQVLQMAKQHIAEESAEDQLNFEESKPTPPARKHSPWRSPWVGGLASAALVLLTVSVFLVTPIEESSQATYETSSQAPSQTTSQAPPQATSPVPSPLALSREPAPALKRGVQLRQQQPAASMENVVVTGAMRKASMDEAVVEAYAQDQVDYELAEGAVYELIENDAGAEVTHRDCVESWPIPAGAEILQIDKDGLRLSQNEKQYRAECNDQTWRLHLLDDTEAPLPDSDDAS